MYARAWSQLGMALGVGAMVVVFTGSADAAGPRSGMSTVMVSVSARGTQADSYAFEPAISGDGRFVAYFSDASNLVPGDTNGWNDVFVYDTLTGAVERVSVTSAGTQVSRGGHQPALSEDGRFVVFASEAADLVAGDTNGFADIFLRDRLIGAGDRGGASGGGTTVRVSVSSTGAQQTGGGAAAPEVSGDGRYVVYWSAAADLVPGDTNENMDVFRYDRYTGRTDLVSVASDSSQGNAQSGYPGGPEVSDNGRYVVFESEASNLVPNDANGNSLDVFVRDMVTGQTRLVSVAPDGTGGDSDSYWPSISDNGRFVAFNSAATNLVTGDANGTWDAFVRDLASGVTTRVSVSGDAVEGNDISYQAEISGDGRRVAFFSFASNLVAGDTNSAWDIFVHDRVTGQTVRASVSSAGRQANGSSQLASLDGDGNAVVYESGATNLVRPDVNRTTDVFLSLR